MNTKTLTLAPRINRVFVMSIGNNHYKNRLGRYLTRTPQLFMFEKMGVWGFSFFEFGANRSAATQGTCPLRHAARPSMARSGADVLGNCSRHGSTSCIPAVVLAHGLRGQVPHITAGFGGFEMDRNRKQQSCSLLHKMSHHS